LKLIRQDKRWIHIADQWTEAEKKEMLEYLETESAEAEEEGEKETAK
jgi:hypothetical protein